MFNFTGSKLKQNPNVLSILEQFFSLGDEELYLLMKLIDINCAVYCLNKKCSLKKKIALGNQTIHTTQLKIRQSSSRWNKEKFERLRCRFLTLFKNASSKTKILNLNTSRTAQVLEKKWYKHTSKSCL